MKKWETVVLLVVIFIGSAVSFYFYEHPGYSNPDFKSYKNEVIYCSQFFGGNHQSDREIYKNWKNRELIGC
jgi:hypothetical protein